MAGRNVQINGGPRKGRLVRVGGGLLERPITPGGEQRRGLV